MKKFIKFFSLIVVPVIFACAFLTGCSGCGKRIDIDNTGIMRDINEFPAQSAAYESRSKQVYSDYLQVAERHIIDGEIDTENEEVIQAANSAAAKLYAYACYNERTLDNYVYFSNQEGLTDLGGSGSATVQIQEYYLRVNESEQTCGYRYHYTIKKVLKASGLVSGAKGLFESARTRVTDKTNLLYRFEGSKIRVGAENTSLGLNMLECNWETGNDWGKPDVEMKKGEYIAPDDVKADIEENAGEDNVTIRGNINILADGIVKRATITQAEDGSIFVLMMINTEVANNDEASMKMLARANESECKWVTNGDDSGFTIFFTLWGNGLFRTVAINECWSGKISGFSGTADKITTYYYSYSDRDCDMSANLEALENAKKLKGE